MLTETTIPDDRIEVLPDGSLQVREATILLRDGKPDESMPARYRRYVLHPGDDLAGVAERIAAIAQAVWTPEAVATWQALRAAQEAAFAEVTLREDAAVIMPRLFREATADE